MKPIDNGNSRYNQDVLEDENYQNGIVYLKIPYYEQQSCMRDLLPEVALWLSVYSFTPIELEILNGGLLSYGSGGTDFQIDTIGIMQRLSCSADAIWSAFLGLCDEGICKHAVYHRGFSRSLDFSIDAEDLHALAEKRERKPKQKREPRRKDTSDCYVYIVDNGFHRKIGISNNVDNRVRQLQTASSLPLTCVYTKLLARTDAANLERRLHAEFQDLNTSGEWFEASLEIIQAKIKAMGFEI